MKNVTLGFVVIAGFLATILASVIYGGYVFSWLWFWFAVPMGLRPISVPLAMGICMLIRTPSARAESGPKREFHEVLFEAVLTNTFIWGVGYIVHLFV